MIWHDESGTQPKHHSGKPRADYKIGCASKMAIASVVVFLLSMIVLLIKAAGG